MKPPSNPADDGVTWRLALAVFSGVLLAWFGAQTAELPWLNFESLDVLFSGLAFAGVILALYMQRKELALQRRELEETREELQRSATAQEALQQALVTAARLNGLQFLINASGGEFIRNSFDKMLGTEPGGTTLRDGLQEDCLAELLREIDRLKPPKPPPPKPT